MAEEKTSKDSKSFLEESSLKETKENSHDAIFEECKEDFNFITSTMLSFVIHAKHYEHILKYLQEKEKIPYVMIYHPYASCTPLFDMLIDHYHLLIWIASLKCKEDFSSHFFIKKMTDICGEEKYEWSYEVARSPSQLLKYLLIFPRKLKFARGNKELHKFLNVNIENPERELKERVELQDKRKIEKIERMRKREENKNDYWIIHNKNPEVICDLIFKYKVNNVEELLNVLVEEAVAIKLDAFLEARNIQILIRNIDSEINRKYGTFTWLQSIEFFWKHRQGKDQPKNFFTPEESVEIIVKWCTLNNINMKDFFIKIFKILYKLPQKINTILVEGPSNSCKSRILNSITQGYPMTRRGDMRSTAKMPFRYCENSSVLECDDFVFRKELTRVVNAVIEGKSVMCRKKGEMFRMKRTPCVWSTGQPLYQYGIKSKDIEAIRSRMYYFKVELHKELKEVSKHLHPYAWYLIYEKYDYIQALIGLM